MKRYTRFCLASVVVCVLFLTSGCSSSNTQNPPNPNNPAVPNNPNNNNPVPYFDELLIQAQREGRSEKYRPLFTSENIMTASRLGEEGSFPQWTENSKRELLEAIIFYEDHDGGQMPPFNGTCSMEGGETPCYRMVTYRVPAMEFVPEYERYLYITHLAWHFYVEANRLTPWSILDYSPRSLSILFQNMISQPRLGRQFYGADLDITENYRIVRGLLHDPRGTPADLVKENSLATMLTITQFIGEQVTHFKGSSRNTVGPASDIWPYRARDAQGNPLYDDQGVRIPLDREPTPKEILIYRDPHHHLERDPDMPSGPRYHIVNGCWGSSKLLKSLLSSINLPLELVGDYGNFGGHSGVRFLEIEGQEYLIQHSDDLYFEAWTYGLPKIREPITGREYWPNPNFSPFESLLPGYSVFHSQNIQWMNQQRLFDLAEVEGENINLFREELGEQFGNGYPEISTRILALRAISNPPSIQNLFTQCEEPNLERRHFPQNYLTAQEETHYRFTLNAEIAKRRQGINPNIPCLLLFFKGLNELYKKKTGISLLGDEDQDGIQNYRDCHPYKADDNPCEGAFYGPLSITIGG